MKHCAFSHLILEFRISVNSFSFEVHIISKKV